MAKVERFEDFEMWKKARELTKAVYAVTSSGMFNRDFVLRDQARRSAVSIMANIAEGFERGGDKEFSQFLAVAKGSCGELRSHLCVAIDQRYLAPAAYQAMCANAVEVSRMISGLMRYLRDSRLRGSKYK